MNDTRSTVRYPTKKSLEAELAALTVTDLRSTVATITAAIERDRAGSTRADGYPRASSGAGVPGGSTGLPSSSVERAALELVDGDAERDRLHENLEQLLATLVELAALKRTFDHRVANLLDIMGPPKPPMCEVLVGSDADHFTDVGGRLHRKHHLSRPVIRYVETYGTLPTEAEREEYRRYGTWRRRVRA